jgi:hypothetical protein
MQTLEPLDPNNQVPNSPAPNSPSPNNQAPNNQAEYDGPSPGVSRSRFTLRSMLLAITLVASILGNFFTSVKLREAVSQRDALRREVGYLDSDNPSAIAAVRAPFDEPLAWKFRIRVPEGGKYRLACSTLWPKGRPAPDWVVAQGLDVGESTVFVRILRDPRDDRWKLSTVVRNESATKRLSAGLSERQSSVFRASTDTITAGVGSATIDLDNGEKLRLLDQRWLSGEGGLLLYGDREPPSDVDGVFVELQPDEGPLNR